MSATATSTSAYTIEVLCKLREAGFRETEEVMVLLKYAFQAKPETIIFGEFLETTLREYQNKFGTDYLIVLLTYTPALAQCCSSLNISHYLFAMIRENLSISAEARSGGLILLSEKGDSEVILAHEYGHQCHRNQMPIWLWLNVSKLTREIFADYIAAQLCGRERTLKWLQSMYAPHSYDCDDCIRCPTLRKRIQILERVEIRPPAPIFR